MKKLLFAGLIAIGFIGNSYGAIPAVIANNKVPVIITAGILGGSSLLLLDYFLSTKNTENDVLYADEQTLLQWIKKHSIKTIRDFVIGFVVVGGATYYVIEKNKPPKIEVKQPQLPPPSPQQQRQQEVAQRQPIQSLNQKRNDSPSNSSQSNDDNTHTLDPLFRQDLLPIQPFAVNNNDEDEKKKPEDKHCQIQYYDKAKKKQEKEDALFAAKLQQELNQENYSSNNLLARNSKGMHQADNPATHIVNDLNQNHDGSWSIGPEKPASKNEQRLQQLVSHNANQQIQPDTSRTELENNYHQQPRPPQRQIPSNQNNNRFFNEKKENEEKSPECSICFDKCHEQLPCKHYVHALCMSEWGTKGTFNVESNINGVQISEEIQQPNAGKICPCCRAPINQ